ncbi:hypothetical protein SAMD00023353_8800160 [Rosellinia necatrix]|uniref:Uncharacterized protein n=1 Tax=Rosellinia necatrix TaxID=77044 RepID=A0A1W2TV85_ROSNE|nr:hypothetical protein SAMD00023353_8800160 [Rosellinia necatrix]
MCRGSKTEMACGHTETHFDAPCGRRCTTPQGPTQYADAPCARCDSEEGRRRRRARAAELMAHLGVGDGDGEVRRLAAQGEGLNAAMRRGVAEAQRAGTSTSSSGSGGRRPWDPDSSEDDGRRDTTRLSDDGRHVVQKEYKLVGGHWALIAYRRELCEIEPEVLAALRAQREREVAREEARARAKEERRRKREAAALRPSTPLTARWAGGEGARGRSVDDASDDSGGAPLTSPSTPAGKRDEDRRCREVSARRQVSSSGRHEPKQARERKQEPPPPPQRPLPSPAPAPRVRADETNGSRRAAADHYARDQAQAEGSAAPARRAAKAGSSWTERFAEDITYDSTDSGNRADSDTDSIVTQIRVPVGQPKDKGKGKATTSVDDKGKGKGKGRVDEDDDLLDVWQKISLENN